MNYHKLLHLALAGILVCALAACERYTVPLLVPPNESGDVEGVLRILNDTDSSASVSISAIDNNGTGSSSAEFTLDAHAAVQFTATDLQSGNATIGLDGGIGTEVGSGRLVIESDARIVPLAFVRASDGALSAMNDTIWATPGDAPGLFRYEVPIFNPASEATHQSQLRLINPGDASASITISGRDDAGAASTGGNVTLAIPGGETRTLTAQQLEAGNMSLTGQLGAGTGTGRLTVSSDQPLQVMNVVAATTGYWNNLSTTAAPGFAPTDIGAFEARFVDQTIVTQSSAGGFTFNAAASGEFTQVVQSDGVSTNNMGDYAYEVIAPDAGRLTLDYDDGDQCRMNVYFSTRTTGWFAANCASPDDSAEGNRSGGNWSLQAATECEVGLLVGVDESCTYPGTMDEFSVNSRGRGSFLTRLAGIRITISNQTIDGRLYNFEASHQGDGVWRIDVVGSGGRPIEQYTLALLVPPGTSDEPQGVLRILNGSEEAGTVAIYAIDDAGARTGPASVSLGGHAAVQLTATDLQSGNADLGLTGSIGTSATNARLELETDLRIVPLSLVRAADGTLSAMHDTVRAGASGDAFAQYSYDVHSFNPSSESTHESRLRLVNPGYLSSAVTINGRDDSGAAAVSGDVTLTIPAGQARTLTAQQLESGDMTLTGQLGDGTGNWRLTVSSDQPLQVLNIVASTTGYSNNLSTTVVRETAPANLAELSEQFVDNTITFRAQGDTVMVSGLEDERFRQSGEIDTTTYEGDLGYQAHATDAGRMTFAYDNGEQCETDMYFRTPTSGWFARHCTGGDHPAEGVWDGGDWDSVQGIEIVVNSSDEDDHGNDIETATVVGIPSETAGALTSGDTDFFRIDVAESRTLQIYTSGSTDTVGRLLDEDGSLIVSDDDSGDGFNFRIERAVSAGTYYVRVAPWGSFDSGSYTLHVR